MSEEMKTREAHIATVAEMGAGGMRVLMPHPPGSTDHLPVGTKLYAAHMDGPQLGGRPEDLRNTLCAVIELFGIDGAQKVTEYVLKHRGINAFDGTKVAALSRLDAGEVCVPAAEHGNDELFWRLRIAYLRGAEWRDQNGSMELSDKASYDYADKITSPLSDHPSSEAHKALIAARDVEIERQAVVIQKYREAQEAEWRPINSCPLRDSVDLWCVYGGEEFAQFDGGASIGFLVSGRFKTEEYGFFGNQSNEGVPRRDGPDLVPVAWRPAVMQCPSALIAEALAIPLTREDAVAALNASEREA